MRDTISATRKRHGSGGFAIRQQRMLLTQGNCPLVRADEITAHSPRHYGSLPTTLRLAVTLLLMITLGVGTTWGQSGIWYIGNSSRGNASADEYTYDSQNPANNYYLVPAADPRLTNKRDAYYSGDNYATAGDPARPFITTYKTNKDNNSIWFIFPSGDGYYYIIHAATGKYLIYEPPHSGATNRKSMHLQTIDNSTYSPSTNNDFKFKIETSGIGYTIRPYSVSSGNSFFNVANRNFNRYYGSAAGSNNYDHEGLVGLYSSGHIWTLENASDAAFVTPDISDISETTNTFTISFPTVSITHPYTTPLTENITALGITSIIYTTNGDEPTVGGATTYTYSSAIYLEESCTIKARGVYGNNSMTPVVSKELTPVIIPPVITFDNTTGNVTLTTLTMGAAIYYTLDGTTEPTSSSILYEGPFSISETTTIKAITIKGGDNSSVTTQTISKVATPTIQNNGSNAISINCATEGATIYYTTDGSDPTTSSTEYTGPLTENVSNVTIKAIAVKEGMITSIVGSGAVKLQCAMPVITREGMTFTLSCSMPTDATFYYSLDGNTPATLYNGAVSFTSDQLPMTVTAVARHNDYTDSEYATFELLNGTGTSSDPYLIYGSTDFANFVSNVNAGITSSACYKLETDVSGSGVDAITTAFTGTFDGDMHTISNLGHALFNTVNGGTVKNVILQGVNVTSGDSDGDAGAICNKAIGATRIYNCGILPTTILHNDPNDEDKITGFSGSSVSGSRYVGSLVGFLDGTARVINCYSYANISGDNTAAGIVGYNAVATTMSDVKTMVMNCMFYSNITGASTMKPVYGGQRISNAGTSGVNGYNYYRNGEDVTFDDSYADFDAYYCTLPADEEYLTRFEYYRSILNSNRKLCVWWITGHTDSEQTAEDGKMMAKWVLDQEIAPYPILKKWGKYPSVINQDLEYVWNPKTRQKVSRTAAEPYQGKQLGTISVTVNAGVKHAGSGATSTTLLSVIVMDMDTLNHDYGYYKIQLPYYNEQFGDPTADAVTEWDKRYAGNYKDYVVTGWKITGIEGGTPGSFKGYAFSANGAVSSGSVSPDDTSGNPWEDGFNFADRNCTNKDLYSKSGRVFAQGGYYYVPEGVTGITIEAYWGKAVYLHNNEHSLDRVNVASGEDGAATAEYGTAFSPAGTLPTKFQNIDVQTTLQDAIDKLTKNSSLTVYDQAIVLVGNVQVKNRSQSVGDNTVANRRPFTIMSIDEDMDNEPDYCLEFQFRQTTDRPGIHPVRFDFLPVPELGLAIRTNQNAYAIGIFIPQGHFEITETAFMHTTQFEYDGNVNRVESPIILNGGHFEQIVVRYGPKDKVNYFLVGGHFRMKRFTPGYHASNVTGGNIRHCVVNAIGGDYPEFYLSGVYRPELAVNADNPHCYINGGRFGTIAGAAYEQVDGNVTFKIDHAIIDKFYGGGMNAAKPVTGNIDVTINNSIVYDIFCGGPMVGKMTKPDGDGNTRKTVTTTADNTIFGKFFGGGNGGTSYYREQKYDNDTSWPSSESDWTGATYYFSSFDPLNFSNSKKYDTNKGYHDQFEFEIFNSSNGLNAKAVIRTIYVWAQFGTTSTGTVTNTLTNCTIENDFYGGGNLGNVDGDVVSTLTNTHVKGSVFGGGFSAEIPRFRVHNTNAVHVPHRNKAGVIDEQGYLEYVQDNSKDRYYRWTNDKNDNTASTDAPTYWSDTDGEYKCYTPISLVGLGEVESNTTLTIDGTSQIDGNVYGGGDASKVKGNSTVNLKDNAHILGDVFGGGNEAEVGGNATVKIMVPGE